MFKSAPEHRRKRARKDAPEREYAPPRNPWISHPVMFINVPRAPKSPPVRPVDTKPEVPPPRPPSWVSRGVRLIDIPNTSQGYDAVLEVVEVKPTPSPVDDSTLLPAPMLDYAAAPEIVERILQCGTLATLLSFRGANRAFKARIDASLAHVVITELPGKFPAREMTCHVHTAGRWYPVLSAASYSCLGKHRKRDFVDKSAACAARYLRRRAEATGTDLVVDIVGDVQPNFGGEPHFVTDFLDKVKHIKEIRHVSTSYSHPMAVFARREFDVVLLNDWKAPARVVPVLGKMAKGTARNVIYRFNQCGGLPLCADSFVNTVIGGAKTVVYDFTEPEDLDWPDSDDDDDGMNIDSNTGKPYRPPIHHFARHAAGYIASGATVVIVGLPSVAWFELRHSWYLFSCKVFPCTPSLESWLLELVVSECTRNGVDPVPPESLTFLQADDSKRLEFMPANYECIDRMEPEGPMIVTARVAGKVW